MKGLMIESNKEFIRIKFNFNFKERLKIAKNILQGKMLQFRLNAPTEDELIFYFD